MFASTLPLIPPQLQSEMIKKNQKCDLKATFGHLGEIWGCGAIFIKPPDFCFLLKNRNFFWAEKSAPGKNRDFSLGADFFGEIFINDTYNIC